MKMRNLFTIDTNHKRMPNTLCLGHFHKLLSGLSHAMLDDDTADETQSGNPGGGGLATC